MSTTFQANSQQLFVDLDRGKAEVLGVKVGDVFQALQGLFGSQVVGQFSQFSRVWFVILQADADYRARPEDFQKDLPALGERRERAAFLAHHHTVRRLSEARDAVQRFPGGEGVRPPRAGL